MKKIVNPEHEGAVLRASRVRKTRARRLKADKVLCVMRDWKWASDFTEYGVCVSVAEITERGGSSTVVAEVVFTPYGLDLHFLDTGVKTYPRSLKLALTRELEREWQGRLPQANLQNTHGEVN